MRDGDGWGVLGLGWEGWVLEFENADLSFCSQGGAPVTDSRQSPAAVPGSRIGC